MNLSRFYLTDDLDRDEKIIYIQKSSQTGGGAYGSQITQIPATMTITSVT